MILWRLVVVVLTTWVVVGAPSSSPSATPNLDRPWQEILKTHEALPSWSAIANPPLQGGPAVAYSYPIGRSGRILGDGFYVRHGYGTENTWYLPGYWHTGEDWYALAGDTAGAGVYAIAAGSVVYAGGNYPGRVVIVEHAGGIYSMYGHLDPGLAVKLGQRLTRGARIGTVLRRGDQTPNHLHFEVRTFLLTTAVNGDAPRYGFRCGLRCPPGPGYWPIKAPDHPGALGWRNPTHVINRQAGLPNSMISSVVVVAERPSSQSTMLWSAFPGAAGRRALQEIRLRPGSRYQLLASHAGPSDSRGTGAHTYVLWYQIQLQSGKQGWVQAAMPSKAETGADGQPSTVHFNFYPAIRAGD